MAPAVAERVVDFARDVRPILSENCFTCHGPDEGSRQRGLRLDVQAGPFADRGEFGGPVIVAGNAEDSLLIHRITASDLTQRMPYRRGFESSVMPGLEDDALTEEEIGTLRLWVDQGADWQAHWAFIPPERPLLPPVADGDWVRNPDRPLRAGPARSRRTGGGGGSRSHDAAAARDARPDRVAADTG